MIALKHQTESSRNSSDQTRLVRVLPDSWVGDVVKHMAHSNAEVAIIESQGKLEGIFTAQDYLKRVVGMGKQPNLTTVKEVMTQKVAVLSYDKGIEEAAMIMHQSNFHYLPIIDRAGKVIGIISALDLLRKRIRELDHENKVLGAYAAVDGIGGD